MAAHLGYDGVEVMIWTDPVSQDVAALKVLTEHYGVPVRSVHAPCLLLTRKVWGTEPWEKLRRSAVLASELGASVVVVHPPFVWQREYATTFGAGLRALHQRFPEIDFAVENMYPVRLRGREFVPYLPSWDPSRHGFEAYTLDLSHCAAARTDAMQMADAMGANLRHVHLGDGTGEGRDEHLVPGRGAQPCGALLASLRARSFTGTVAVEVSTRRARSRRARAEDLGEALAFAREHLGAPAAKARTA